MVGGEGEGLKGGPWKREIASYPSVSRRWKGQEAGVRAGCADFDGDRAEKPRAAAGAAVPCRECGQTII